MEFDHIVGVSGGSIVASMYAAGVPIEQIKEIAFDTDYNQLLSFSLLRLIRNGGLSSGDALEKWAAQLLDGKTFEQLNLKLHIVATDVKSGKPVIFDAERTPTIKVSMAVRVSMSIPLVFSFKVFEHRITVDGSILSDDTLHRGWGNKSTPVLCFRLRGEHEYDKLNMKGMFPIVNYATLLIRTFMTTISREHINDGFWHNTVIINTRESSPVDFNMSKFDKQTLFHIGFQTAIDIVLIKTKVTINQACKIAIEQSKQVVMPLP